MIISGGALVDPTGTNAMVVAARWIESLLFGSFATIAATLAVAGIGAAMLMGRLPLRRGMMVLMGCFVLIGAKQVAVSIGGFAIGEAGSASVAVQRPAAVPPPVPLAPPPGYDPEAGASTPMR